MEGPREYWIDVVRSFACLCVITTHAPIPSNGSGASIIGVTNYFSVAGASILFFMISGSLVLYKEKPIIPFIKTRILRIFLPMTIWSVISLFVDYLQHGISGSELLKKVLMIPFTPQVGNYWFIYVIFGIYLLAPSVAYWLNRVSRKSVEFYLLIWVVTLFIPYLELINPGFKGLLNDHSGYLYYFYGYLGFAVLGYYLRRYVTITKVRLSHVLSLVLILLMPVLLYSVRVIPHATIHNRMSINIVLLSVCYFIVIKHIRWPEKVKFFCYEFARHSFGIYLIHLLIMRKLIWPLLESFHMNYFIQIPIVVVLTAILSFIVVHAISKVPCSKYIIGL